MPENRDLDRIAFPRLYTLGEEIANAITHGVGTGLSIAGLTVLVVLAALGHDTWKILSFSIYGATLVLLNLASTLYHSFQHPRAKRIFRFVDHGSIFLLIAGTYTPFLLVNLRDSPWGWTLFGIVWGIALAGILFKAIFLGKLRRLSVVAYVAMGWLAVFAWKEMFTHVPTSGLVLVGIGGVVYTLGLAFYGWKKLPYSHAIWHLFVLAGSACHFFAVLFYVLPSQG